MSLNINDIDTNSYNFANYKAELFHPNILKEPNSICLNLLDNWKQSFLTLQNIQYTALTGGLSNELYIVQHNDPDILPKKVILRYYGSSMQHLVSHQDEVYIAEYTSKKGVNSAKKLASIGKLGRIEQYISGKTLNLNILYQYQAILLPLICKQLYNLHQLDPPLLLKNKAILWTFFEKWLPQVNKNTRTILDYQEEIKWLYIKINDEQECLEHDNNMKHNHIVFCHNDAQEGNWIWDNNNTSSNHHQKMKKMHLIDYEYSGYNYLLFELANICCEFEIDNFAKFAPFFSIKNIKLLKKSIKNFTYDTLEMQFLSLYCQMNKHCNIKLLIKYLDIYRLASHLLWSLWGIIQNQYYKNENENFNYLMYSNMRTECYLHLKQKVQGAELE